MILLLARDNIAVAVSHMLMLISPCLFNLAVKTFSMAMTISSFIISILSGSFWNSSRYTIGFCILLSRMLSPKRLYLACIAFRTYVWNETMDSGCRAYSAMSSLGSKSRNPVLECGNGTKSSSLAVLRSYLDSLVFQVKSCYPS